MSKNMKGILVVVGIAAIAAGVWYFHSHTKRYYAQKIAQYGGTSSVVGLLAFDEGYLKEWAKALLKLKDRFTYEGKDYYTAGGKAVI